MTAAAGGDGEGSREPHSQLFPDALAKVSLVFGTHLADVFVKHREVETLTGEKNVIGRQNLVEALAHLSILFARAPELDRDKQLEQVAFFNDHLRRVMMESFEVYVYVMIAEHWDNTEPKSVGRRYDAVAAPLIRREKLLGHIAPDEVDREFKRLSANIVSARRSKIADEDWDVWSKATEDLKAAAEKMKDLKLKMGAAVDAANERVFHRRLMLVGGALSAALGVGLTLLVQAAT